MSTTLFWWTYLAVGLMVFVEVARRAFMAVLDDLGDAPEDVNFAASFAGLMGAAFALVWLPAAVLVGVYVVVCRPVLREWQRQQAARKGSVGGTRP